MPKNQCRDYMTLENLEKLPENILDLLFDVEDIFRLLYYTDDPLNPSKPNLTYEQKNALIGKDLNDKDARIYFVGFNDDVIDEEIMQMRIYIGNIFPINDILAEVTVGIDIICHNNLRLIGSSGIRTIRLLNLIVNALNGHEDSGGLGDLKLPVGVGMPLRNFNDSFQGYTFGLTVNWG